MNNQSIKGAQVRYNWRSLSFKKRDLNNYNLIKPATKNKSIRNKKCLKIFLTNQAASKEKPVCSYFLSITLKLVLKS